MVLRSKLVGIEVLRCLTRELSWWNVLFVLYIKRPLIDTDEKCDNFTSVTAVYYCRSWLLQFCITRGDHLDGKVEEFKEDHGNVRD